MHEVTYLFHWKLDAEDVLRIYGPNGSVKPTVEGSVKECVAKWRRFSTEMTPDELEASMRKEYNGFIDEDDNIVTMSSDCRWDYYVEILANSGEYNYPLRLLRDSADVPFARDVDWDKTPLPYSYVDAVGRWISRDDFSPEDFEAKYKKYIDFIRTMDEVDVYVLDVHS